MKPWATDSSWFRRYAERAAQIKRLPTSRSSLAKIREAISASFQTVYRTVAFDVDGTLTRRGDPALDPAMVGVVVALLQRGVPVILVTGRGRSSTRAAASEIRATSSLSPWYLRRLQCITHNGVFLLSTPEEDPTAFLEDEQLLGDQLATPALEALRRDVHQLLKAEEFHTDQVKVTTEPHSLRLIFSSPTHCERCEGKLRIALRSAALKPYGRIFLTRGAYGASTCLDIARANKGLALKAIALRMGITPNKILRLGDQGQTGGNDFDLLNSSAGFSVDLLSTSATTCFPVLSQSLLRQLKGARATRQLLSSVLLFPPLSISATPVHARLKALRAFEQQALQRSRDESATVTSRIRVRLRYLLADGPSGNGGHRFIDVHDLYDPLSGAVRVRDWELTSIDAVNPARELFQLSALDLNGPPRTEWSMHTDSAILLRGSHYYWGLSRPKASRTLAGYLPGALGFLVDAGKALAHLAGTTAPDLTSYKIALGIADNVRNILLHIVSAAFMIEAQESTQHYPMTRLVYSSGLVPHTRTNLTLLMDPDTSWTRWTHHYQLLLTNLRTLLRSIGRRIQRRLTGNTEQHTIFKWRECDSFLQNVTAVQLGLHEHTQRWPRDSTPKRVIAVGLAYGAIELPAIAAVVANARGLQVTPALAHVSLYNDKRTGRLVRSGGHDYVSKVLLKDRSMCVLDGTSVADRPCLIMDDNCTTAITLQLARDSLVMLGADVVGAILVRFPGVNRLTQMAMPGHGCPDPGVLFSVIRGLVSPSPYARLLTVNERPNEYLDSTGLFDKARQRIERYLQKVNNG